LTEEQQQQELEDFQIRVTGIEEHEDGDATVYLDMTATTKAALIEYAFVSLLKKCIQNDTSSDANLAP